MPQSEFGDRSSIGSSVRISGLGDHFAHDHSSLALSEDSQRSLSQRQRDWDRIYQNEMQVMEEGAPSLQPTSSDEEETDSREKSGRDEQRRDDGSNLNETEPFEGRKPLQNSEKCTVIEVVGKVSRRASLQPFREKRASLDHLMKGVPSPDCEEDAQEPRNRQIGNDESFANASLRVS